VVATEIVPTPAPLESGYDDGFAVQFVFGADDAHETVTGAENPKNGVTSRSLMYCAVVPADTVCELIPPFASAKSGARFSVMITELDAA